MLAEAVSHCKFVGIGAVVVAFKSLPPALRPNDDNHVRTYRPCAIRRTQARNSGQWKGGWELFGEELMEQ